MGLHTGSEQVGKDGETHACLAIEKWEDFR
jgi:hypothetical protein